MESSIKYLKKSNFKLDEEIDFLIKIPSPENIFESSKNEKFDFGQYAYCSFLRLAELVSLKENISKFPELSFQNRISKTKSTSYNAYKLTIVRLVYFHLYCLNKMDTNDEVFIDAISAPMKPLAYDESINSEITTYYLISNHASLLICATKWIEMFSKDSLSNQLKSIFLKPMLTYTSTMLSYNSNDLILKWGANMMRGICSKSITHLKQFIEFNEDQVFLNSEMHFNRIKFIKLSNGDENLLKKLGPKLYTEFEKELVKIFDAFGFFVSHTKIGKKRVDLIISTPKPNSYTFLVDAKSSKSNYSLPASDSRAIKEYILQYEESSDIMPSLKFFLIISSNHSKTLETKLKILSNETGVPVRFISASTFADIVENCNWNIYPNLLIKAITESNFILDKDWSRSLIESIRKKKNAFNKYVELITE